MSRKKAKDNEGYGVLLEQIIHQNNILLENIGSMRDKVKLIPLIVQRLDRMELEHRTFRQAIKSLSSDVQNHETRIRLLDSG